MLIAGLKDPRPMGPLSCIDCPAIYDVCSSWTGCV